MTGHDQPWVPPGVDPERADVARVYDYFLGRAVAYMAGPWPAAGHDHRGGPARAGDRAGAGRGHRLVGLPFWRPPEPPDPDVFWGGFAGVGRKP